jgi:hypothetical protein
MRPNLVLPETVLYDVLMVQGMRSLPSSVHVPVACPTTLSDCLLAHRLASSCASACSKLNVPDIGRECSCIVGQTCAAAALQQQAAVCGGLVEHVVLRRVYRRPAAYTIYQLAKKHRMRNNNVPSAVALHQICNQDDRADQEDMSHGLYATPATCLYMLIRGLCQRGVSSQPPGAQVLPL